MALQFLPKAQFDLMFNNSRDFVFFMEKVDDDFKYIYLNDSAKQMLSGDVCGKTLSEVLPKRNSKIIIEYYNRAIELKQQMNYQDFIYLLAEVKKYESTVLPIFYEDRIMILTITKEIAFDRDLEDKYLFMRSVFFKTFLSTVLISSEGRLLEANPQFLKDFNLNIDEVKWRYIYDLPMIDSKNKEQWKAYLREVCNGNSLASKLLTFVDKDGKHRSFTANFTPMIQNDDVVAVFIILQEITHYLEQEKELRTTSVGLDNFKLAINSASEVSITDTNGILIDVNEQFMRKTGYIRDELIGKTPAILNSRYHSKEFFSNLWNTIQNGEVWHGEICNRSKCGVPYWVDTTIIPLLDENGDIYQYMSIQFDITEKKRMLTELRNIEHMFTMITENTNDLIVITNEDGIILFASSAYYRKLGFTKEELMGQFYTKVLSEESKEIWNDELLNIEDENSKIELIHHSKDGKSLWTECNYTVVKDYVRNRGTQIIMVAREITERKEFENKLLFLAYHDALTQLPNRRSIQKEFPHFLETARLNSESIALLYIDGDNFKTVNDQFGHEVGDEFLIQFGQALLKSVRNDDFVVRIGGDEFVVVLTGLARNEEIRDEQVKQVVERIKENLKVGWIISDQLFTPTASIGISYYPDHGQGLEELLEYSDQALYEIKLTSKDDYKIYQN